MTDTLCYIMDGSGNYYRINNKDQLVTAGNREQADFFTFAEANSRIGGGKKSHFYSAIPINSENESKRTETMPELLKSAQTEAVKEEINKEGNNVENSNINVYDMSQIDWLEYLNHFAFVGKSIKKYQDELSQTLSNTEMELCDVMHYVELCELDEDQSLYAIDLLRDIRDRRREVKDELFRIEWLQKALGGSSISNVEESIKQLGKLKRRRYIPRRLPELFEKTTKRENHQSVTEDRKRGGYDTMEMVRKETVYDNRENDWLNFAKEQLQFYGNVRQYMINLELDLERIDQEIEVILTGIEDASCNVTQGYKVFRHLKDLRVERRMKDKELSCLEAITRNFDCEAMEEEFRYIAGTVLAIVEPQKQMEEAEEVDEEAKENLISETAVNVLTEAAG